MKSVTKLNSDDFSSSLNSIEFCDGFNLSLIFTI